MKNIFDKHMGIFFVVFFGLIAITSFVGGCNGYVWQFYISALSAILAGVVYMAEMEDRKTPKN